jgi:hypothetical protein
LIHALTSLPAEAYQLCRFDWMHEALAVLLERLSVIEPVAAAAAAVQKLTLLQKYFIVSAVKLFFVSVSPVDTIRRIQKIDYFSYRLFPTDT